MYNLMIGWKDGSYTGKSSDETLQLNSKYIGSVEQSEIILEYVDYIRSSDDESSDENSASGP